MVVKFVYVEVVLIRKIIKKKKKNKNKNKNKSIVEVWIHI